MFRAMMSQQQQQQQQQLQQQQQPRGSCPPPQFYQQVSPHSVTSTLVQIGVDPGYYSDSECSSNSSEKVTEEGNVSPPQNKLSRIPEQHIQQTPATNFNCFNDYFGFNDLVKPLPLRYGPAGQEDWQQDTWKGDSATAEVVSEGGESVEETYTPATSPPSSAATPPSVTAKKNTGKRNKCQVCVFCRNNGEDESVYSTHSLKSGDGKVTCPILFAYECPICRSTGDNAHTLKYCPKNPNGQGGQQQQGNQSSAPHASNGYQGYTGSNNMGYGSNSNRGNNNNGNNNAKNVGNASNNNSNNNNNSGNNQINHNLLQAMVQMSGGALSPGNMTNGNMHPALAQLNFNMAAMLCQQQEPQPSNPFAEWLQQQQQQQQFSGGDDKAFPSPPQESFNPQQQAANFNPQQQAANFNPQQQAANFNPQQQAANFNPQAGSYYPPQQGGSYNPTTSPTYSQNYNTGYSANNHTNSNYTPSNSNFTANNTNNSYTSSNNSSYTPSNNSNYTPPAEVYQDAEIESSLTQLFGKASIEDFMQNYSR